MFVYRLQYTNGFGYYCKWENTKVKPSSDGWDRPMWWQDYPERLVEDMRTYRYGFARLCDLRRWFSYWPAEGDWPCSDLHLAVFDVPREHIVMAQSQLIFKPEHATLVALFPVRKQQ